MLTIQNGNMQEGDSSRNNTSHQNFAFYPYQNIGRRSSKLHMMSMRSCQALPKHSECPLALPCAFLRDKKHVLLRVDRFEIQIQYQIFLFPLNCWKWCWEKPGEQGKFASALSDFGTPLLQIALRCLLPEPSSADISRLIRKTALE